MSIVLAKKFDKRLIVLSDTEVSDVNQIDMNSIPGLLKTIVVSKDFTISYAGSVEVGMSTIRKIKSKINQTDFNQIVEILKSKTKDDYNTEFLLCSNKPNLKLCKINQGKLYEGANFYWIGNKEAANYFSKAHENYDYKPIGKPYCISVEEQIFERKFHDNFFNHTIEGVGGIPIRTLCGPLGHCYQSIASSFSWDRIRLDGLVDPTREEKMRSGQYTFKYNLYGPKKRGVSVLGLFLPQVDLCFIYDPMHEDYAKYGKYNYGIVKKFNSIKHEKFRSFVDDYAEGLVRI